MHEKDFYNDLSGVLERSWLLLEQSIEDPTSPVRTPVLISVSADGLAQGRTVVLRAFNRQQRQLKIYTDVRSEKVAQLRTQPVCTLVAYQPNPMIQLRLKTNAVVNHNNEITRESWAVMPGPNRCNYLTDPNPGSISVKATDGRPIINAESVPTNDENEIAYSHFSVIVFAINELEWLYLPRRGHRRAQFIWDRTKSLQSNWLIP
jgi:3-hydroxyisobutyrate dehydrogenase